jgi:[protein-PII] uridylyltransferase
MARHLKVIRTLHPNEATVEAIFHHDLKICEYLLMTHETMKPGIFMNATGVLAAMGLQVLDAQIVTRNDGIVVDTFSVSDPDYAGQPPAIRLEAVGQTIIGVLKGQESVDQVAARCQRVTFGRRFPTGRQQTDVQIDNETSDHYTVIDVFADDKQGLLYIIAQAIFELGLSIHTARIGTRLDQVVDVFYVTDSTSSKVHDPALCETIAQTIQRSVDTFLDA